MDDDKLPRDRKRSMSLVSMNLSVGSHEGLYSPNEHKSSSLVDLLHQEYCNEYDSKSKPRSNSVGPEELLRELDLVKNKSNSSICLIDLNCKI